MLLTASSTSWPFRLYSYDAAHRLTGMRDALGDGLSYTLDGNDNRTAVGLFNPTDTIVEKRSFAYDNVNRLIAENRREIRKPITAMTRRAT